MDKQGKKLFLLLAYCIPFAFLAMNGDASSGTMLFYAVMAISFALLFYISVRAKGIWVVIVGNGLSFLSSYYFILKYKIDKWDWYFKPFTAIGLLKVITFIALAVQISGLLYVKKKG